MSFPSMTGRLLLEWRAAVDMVNGQGATPLLIAAEAGHSEVLLAFLRRGWGRAGGYQPYDYPVDPF